jgi:hypothetical protein
MHRGQKTGPFVSHKLIRGQGALVRLLKSQMASRLILLISSGSKKTEPRYTVVSRPDPGRECILDVALLGEGRSSNLGQDSEVKAAHSSNNFSVLDTWVLHYVLVSELQQDENLCSNVPLTSPQSSLLLDVS